MSRRSGLVCASLVALVAATVPATASPLDDPFLGGVVFTGPTHAHPTSFYYNPAALGLDSGTHIFFAGTGRLDQLSIDRAAIDATGTPGGSTEIPSVNTTLITPGGFFAVYSDFNGQRVTLGISVYTPYAERSITDQQPLRYHTLGGHHYDVTATPAVSFRVNDRLQIGFGVSIIPYSSMRLRFARDTALEAGTAGLQSDCDGSACGAENPLADEVYDVRVSSKLNIGFNVGLVVRVRETWFVGAGYVSPTSSFGRLVVEANGTVEATAAPRDGGTQYDGRARLTYKLPQSVFLGARGPLLEDYDLVLGARFHHNRRQDEMELRMFGGDLADGNVPEWYPRYRGLKNVFALEAGIEGHERTRLRLGARARIETGAVGESRLAPHQVYGFNASLAGGLEYRPTQELALALGYALVFYPTGTASPSAFDPTARVDCVDADYAFDRCEAAREGRGIPSAEGDYSRLQHALSVGMRYDWF